MVRSICVFCGSRMGGDQAYFDGANAMGGAIARRGIELIYGGAKVGLMGALANGALAEGGRVVGIIPRGLVAKEVAHENLAELFITDSMHERKNRMIELSDAFVAMPGGFGTYDELFEVITLAQIGFHQKPSALLNTKRYFDPLVALMQHTIDESFASAEDKGLWLVEEDPDRLLDAILAWTPPVLANKWKSRQVVES